MGDYYQLMWARAHKDARAAARKHVAPGGITVIVLGAAALLWPLLSGDGRPGVVELFAEQTLPATATALLAALAIVGLIFLWSLICAPVRIHQDQCVEIRRREDQVGDLEAKLQPRLVFRYGSTSPYRGDIRLGQNTVRVSVHNESAVTIEQVSVRIRRVNGVSGLALPVVLGRHDGGPVPFSMVPGDAVFIDVAHLAWESGGRRLFIEFPGHDEHRHEGVTIRDETAPLVDVVLEILGHNMSPATSGARLGLLDSENGGLLLIRHDPAKQRESDTSPSPKSQVEIP